MPGKYFGIPAALTSLLMLGAGMLADHLEQPSFFTGLPRLAWYLLAYLPVGLPVVRKAADHLIKGDIFTEFFLMSLATLGAFAIGEYPEGVAVMLFYTIGEILQGEAVGKAKRNITALLDLRPASATVHRDGAYRKVRPEDVEVGEQFQVKAGERVPLDGVLLSDEASFDTSALTGESRPSTLKKGASVLAGMINIRQVAELKAEKPYEDSSISRILKMVREAQSRKAPTELFIRRLARVYTPLVTFMALGLIFLPALFSQDYIFREWLYRGLIFLVISCPCALVVSIPLGYFGGIGAASRKGILFKGSVYLDLIRRVNTVVLDKTGTLTEGVFEVQEIRAEAMDEAEFIRLAAALESRSSHPAARAVVRYAASRNIDYESLPLHAVEEIPGMGLKGQTGGREVLAGSTELLKRAGIAHDPALDQVPESLVAVAVDGHYAGHFLIADRIREDAAQAVRAIREAGIGDISLLSGDRSAVVRKVAGELGITQYYGDLLPEDKVRHMESLKKESGKTVAFVGDGINDAPVLALSDVGIAMGGLGSDAAIETAGVVIQTDQPSRVASAIRIGRATRSIVWQNIGMALGVKALVLGLGALGMASMWGAVFADVGVALLAIANAVRIQYKEC